MRDFGWRCLSYFAGAMAVLGSSAIERGAIALAVLVHPALALLLLIVIPWFVFWSDVVDYTIQHTNRL